MLIKAMVLTSRFYFLKVYLNISGGSTHVGKIMLTIRMLTIGIMLLAMSYMTLFETNMGEIADSKTDAVVLIVKNDKTDSRNNGIGAGFFIGPNVIVTNTHVIDNASDISVQSYNNAAMFDATVIAKNYTTDIALIQLNNWDDYLRSNRYTALDFASSKDLKQGEEVWSIGHPWGLYWTVSHGIVSSANRRIDASMMYYIQTDASIHQGNSGGPLLNSDGDVVGIVSKVFSLTRSDGFGLAIPSDIVIDTVKQLKDTGSVSWSTVGIDLVQTLDGKAVEVDNVLDWPSTKGVDIKKGDILTEITTSNTGLLGAKINNVEDFVNELVITDPGEQIILTLLRNGKVVHVSIVTEPLSIK